jgi:hypothetical protein
MKWMARGVQFPNKPGEVAIVFRGDQGVGKSFVALAYGALFGRHFMAVSDTGHLVGKFNAHLRGRCVLFADEAFFAGDKKHEGVLKMLITGETIAIEMKGYDVEEYKNRIHLIMASNSDWVVSAGAMERRFFVLDVSPDQRQNLDYFKAIDDQMKSGGREALLHTLKTIDLSDFNVRRVPITNALQEQKVLSHDVMHDWWYNKLSNGRLFSDDTNWNCDVQCELLVDDFIAHSQRFGNTRRSSESKLGRFLNRVCQNGNEETELSRVQRNRQKTLTKRDGEEWQKRCRPYYYVLPELARCRALWCLRFGPVKWPDPVPFDDEGEANDRAF